MSGSRPHILCIDDDHQTAGLIAEELTERGMRVSLAFDGQQGFQAILDKQPDIVLADISMPVMSGFELLAKLTALAPRFEAMPFVYLTALADREHELHGRQLGADDYVVKPIDFDILFAIIQARLSRVARHGTWTRSVDLTEREIEALTWAARGKTSSEIAVILGVTKRTVDFHIDNARRKLNASSRMHAIAKAAVGQMIDP